MSAKKVSILLISIGVLFTVLAGRYAKSLFTTSEFVHFSVNYPTEKGTSQLPVAEVGGPWSMLPKAEWTGYPQGGLIAWGRENAITVDLGKQGILKNIVDPWSVLLSSHWIRNVGPKSRTICIELKMCGFPVHYDTFERQWDPNTHCSTRKMKPQELYNMDWIFEVPSSHHSQKTICEGAIQIRDGDTSELLTRLPIQIIHSGAPTDDAV